MWIKTHKSHNEVKHLVTSYHLKSGLHVMLPVQISVQFVIEHTHLHSLKRKIMLCIYELMWFLSLSYN